MKAWLAAGAVVGLVVAGLGATRHHGPAAGVVAPRPAVAAEPPDDLLTVAERSGFRATARHAEMVELLDRLAAASPLARRVELGRTVEGRTIPVLTIARPAVATPEECAGQAEDGKVVVLLYGNIHAGEVDGKEALPMLARELLLTPDHPLLDRLVVLVAPIYNADGNEQVSKDNRPGQVGPEDGMGVRTNAVGLDLNRDFIKLEAPETRALVRFVNAWNPHVIVDTHTTNGSYHRYVLTHAGPRAAAGDPAIIAYARDTLIPGAARRAAESSGLATFHYGNFNRDKSRWESFPAEPRFGTSYFGLAGRLTVLTEGYSYATYEERVRGTLTFCRAVLEQAAEEADAVRAVVGGAASRAEAAGRDPSPEDAVAIRSRLSARPGTFTALGWEEIEADGRTTPTDVPRDYELEVWDQAEAVLAVARPYAYLVPPAFGPAVETLRRHGIRVDELREDVELDIEVYVIDTVTAAMQPFQGHRTVSADATPRAEARRVPAGTMVVRTGQRLGRLAVMLLEPESEDGLTTWNFFDDGLKPGADFPVIRVPRPAPLLTVAAADLPEDRGPPRTITYEGLYESPDPPNLNGSPAGGFRWLDAEHYSMNRDGRAWRVHAATGRAEPIADTTAAAAAALAAVPVLGAEAARRLAGRPAGATADGAAAFYEHDNDLYYARLDGSEARRLTATPGREELASFSPDGRFVAFVLDNDLHVVDVATGADRALTETGGPTLRNGKHDWVYFEELYGRSWRAYWWSPDSTRLAFFETDLSMVPRFTVVDDLAEPQRVEVEGYPRPGEPNPRVRLGVVSVAGSSPSFVDLSEYETDGHLISMVGWWPDSSRVYFAVQNRTQTWLDFCTAGARGGRADRLFRDQTGAWIEAPPAPDFLPDGSFLLSSDRTGWRHLYRYDAKGRPAGAVTAGEWEVRRVHGVDAEGGWVYFSATADSHIAESIYRAPIGAADPAGAEGSPAPTRLTPDRGSHSASFNSSSTLFIDTWSDRSTPPRVVLRSADGAIVRTLDTNPVRDLDRYDLPPYELLTVTTRDGFELEASLLRPPGFDPGRRYPVWITTYAGPHAPVVSDDWGGGRGWWRAISAMGIVIAEVDPRPASGKGSRSAWTAYRRLGQQEVADLDEFVAWLRDQPWADASRIGLSGYSYGGYMTAYALTHSTSFAAGIAGAPVTDWRLYDSIYTERYMGTPQENPAGYDAGSVVAAAGNLHGRLLVVHGAIDDNVHLQNTTRLSRALQDAGVAFELMIYPGYRHGVWGRHYQRLQRDFIGRTMLDGRGPAGPAGPTLADEPVSPAQPGP